MMNRWLSQTRAIAASTSSRIGPYWAWRSSSGTFIWRDYRPQRGPRSLIRSAARFDCGARFAVGLTALDRLTFVVLLFSLGEAHGHLHAAVFEVHAHRYERHPFLDGLADQLADLVAMQQQLPAPQRLVLRIPAMAVRADVHVVDEHLAVFDAGEAVAQVHTAFADRFYLGAEEHDAGLEGFEQMVVVGRLAVLGDVRLRFLALRPVGHKRRYLRPCCASLAASSTAAIMLPASAPPLPAMSNAVP